jgi:hypothetical protein
MLSQKTFRESDFYGITRLAMNCQSCDTTIDYRFQINCARCETEEANLPILPIEAPIDSLKKRLTWVKRVVNFLYVLISSAAGMISGGVVLYFAGAIIYRAFLRSSDNVPHSCGGPAEAIAILSIWGGAFLGTVGGSVFAMKKPICKNS